MTGAFHTRKKPKQSRTVVEIQGWRKLKKDNGWSLKELAEYVGISPTAISKWLDKEMHGEIRE